MNFSEGKEFNQVSPEIMIDYLKNLKRLTHTVIPGDISLFVKEENIFLQVRNSVNEEYPVRKSFINKLLNWYHMPKELIPKLSVNSIVSVGNDFIGNIKSEKINVKVENGEATTITSSNYTDLTDLDVINICKNFEIDKISRNDYFLRIYTKIKHIFTPFEDEKLGIGYNIFNSETGFRALSIYPYLYRFESDSTGVVEPKNYSQKQIFHFGVKIAQMKKYIGNKMAVNGKNFKKIEGSVVKLDSRIPKEFSRKLIPSLDRMMFRTERETLFRKLSENSTAYDLYNTITSYAKKFDIGKQLYLEQIAGRMLE